jgi:(p)ppGpp synthase/HD superfamily hydrolase
MDSFLLTERFEEALLYATRLHRGQLRKGSRTPYLAHLLAVTALVIEDGGDEDQAIAALLHDAAEDQGGIETLAEIRRLFGQQVADIVDGCTDTYLVPKPPWRERKERYIDHLQTASQAVQRVSLADKLHNARSILLDLHHLGESTWERFNGGKDGTLWYYRKLVRIFQVTNRSPMVDELVRVVAMIEKAAED